MKPPLTKPAPRPTWRVAIYLGDQCSWAIVGNVEAKTEVSAIAKARAEVEATWPFWSDIARNCPASAVYLGG
jgi:hypothetical protein